MTGKFVYTGTGWARLDSLAWSTNLAVGTSANAGQVAVVADSTPHALGAWVEIAPSLSSSIQAVSIMVRASTAGAATDTSCLLEIGHGSAGAEVVDVASIPIGWAAVGTRLVVPCSVASGQRLVARCRAAVASQSNTLTILGMTGPDVGGSIPLGANTAASRGVILTASTAVTSLAAWTEITPSTAAAYQGLIVAVQGGADTVQSNTSGIRVDIGIGASSSEVVIGSNFFSVTISEAITQVSSEMIQYMIPAGSRLSARCANATGDSVDVVLLAVPFP